MQSELIPNLIPMLPEIYLCLVALVLLLLGVYAHARITPMLIVSAISALVLTILLLPQGAAGPVVVMNGMFVADRFATFVKILILSGTALVLMISSGWMLENEGRPFEFLLLVLLAALGMMLMVSAASLLSLYMGLELTSLSLYVLAAFQRDDGRSSEAGLKYFMLGALASGMLLFGISLVYGFTGVIGFEELARHLSAFSDEAGGNAMVPSGVTVGMVLIIIGMCFKVAAVPFHMWAPDVYEGSPTPVTAFFSIAPKIAALALFSRLLMQPFADLAVQWRQVIAVVSFASMALGALAALRQTNIKRLLAYSSIGHVGFMLMGLAAGNDRGVQGMLIYMAVYLVTTAGAFGCVLLMKRDGHYVETISDLSGLSRKRPVVAFAFSACMFSLAGIPPLAGFFGKLYVILAAIEAGYAPLAVAGLLTSVISCYYYLRVVKFMVFDEPQEALDEGTPLGLRVGLVLSVGAVLLFFAVPGPLMAGAKAAGVLLLQ